jgi:hypothetical protein
VKSVEVNFVGVLLASKRCASFALLLAGVLVGAEARSNSAFTSSNNLQHAGHRLISRAFSAGNTHAVVVRIGDGPWRFCPLEVEEVKGMRDMEVLKKLQNMDEFKASMEGVALDKCSVVSTLRCVACLVQPSNFIPTLPVALFSLNCRK